MKQVWIPRIGGPEVLDVREAPDPMPADGQVRIRVAAAGVNFADILARMGLYPDAPPLPAVVGYEVAGTIDAVGADVPAELAPGTRVGALVRFGGYSSAVIVPATQVARLPDGISFEKAAAVPVNYLTAWLMLVELGNVQSGERVLVHGAAGGVGLAALQIARLRGAQVIGTASASKHERLRALGVAHCIDYTTTDFEAEIRSYTSGKGVDIVLDAIGGKSFAKSYRSLAPLGRLFMFGVSSMAAGSRRNLFTVARALLALPRFRPISLINENRGVFGFNLGHLWGARERLQRVFLEILKQVAAASLDPIVDRTFPFEQAGQAHAYLQSRKSFGKVLLTP